MRAFPLRACAVILLALLAGPVAAQPAQPIESRTPMPGPVVDVVSPRGENWQVRTEANGDLITFTRFGRGLDTTELARVIVLGLDAEADDAAFFEAVQAEMEAGRGDPSLFERVESSQTEVTRGDARCIRTFDLTRHPAAVVGDGKTREMFRAMHALHCRHPSHRDIGLSFLFSVRSIERQDETTIADADAFFDSIEMHARRKMPGDAQGAD